jgi:hypothetical protein
MEGTIESTPFHHECEVFAGQNTIVVMDDK